MHRNVSGLVQWRRARAPAGPPLYRGSLQQATARWTNSSNGAPVHSTMIFDYDLTPQSAASMPAGTIDFVWGAKAELVPHWRSGQSKNLVVSRYQNWNRDSYLINCSNTSSGMRTLAWWQQNHPDWIVYRSDRKTPAWEGHDVDVPIDASNPAVVEWQLDRVEEAIRAGYNAMATDNVHFANTWAAAGVWDRAGRWHQKYTGQLWDQSHTAVVLKWLQVTNTLASPFSQ